MSDEPYESAITNAHEPTEAVRTRSPLRSPIGFLVGVLTSVVVMLAMVSRVPLEAPRNDSTLGLVWPIAVLAGIFMAVMGMRLADIVHRRRRPPEN